MTYEQAMAKVETKWWETATPHEIVAFQLFEDRLCMPFALYQNSLETVLGRGVQTLELGVMRDELQKEFLGLREAVSLEETLDAVDAHQNFHGLPL